MYTFTGSLRSKRLVRSVCVLCMAAMYVNVCMYMYTCICTFTVSSRSKRPVLLCVRVGVCMYVHVYIHTYIHQPGCYVHACVAVMCLCMYVYVYTHTHTHTHTHTYMPNLCIAAMHVCVGRFIMTNVCVVFLKFCVVFLSPL